MLLMLQSVHLQYVYPLYITVPQSFWSILEIGTHLYACVSIALSKTKRIITTTVVTPNVSLACTCECGYPFFIQCYPHPHIPRCIFQIHSISQAMAKFKSDRDTPVWAAKEEEHYFRDLVIEPLDQRGPTCVSTCLAMLTGRRPEDFQGNINTQDPVSWSAALQPYGMKLAYFPHDARKFKFYIEELIALDDLFVLSFYTTRNPNQILADPDSTGFVTQSHFILLHRDKIFDSAGYGCTPACEHRCLEHHTKRIFRVLPATHARGLWASAARIWMSKGQKVLRPFRILRSLKYNLFSLKGASDAFSCKERKQIICFIKQLNWHKRQGVYFEGDQRFIRWKGYRWKRAFFGPHYLSKIPIQRESVFPPEQNAA